MGYSATEDAFNKGYNKAIDDVVKILNGYLYKIEATNQLNGIIEKIESEINYDTKRT